MRFRKVSFEFMLGKLTSTHEYAILFMPDQWVEAADVENPFSDPDTHVSSIISYSENQAAFHHATRWEPETGWQSVNQAAQFRSV